MFYQVCAGGLYLLVTQLFNMLFSVKTEGGACCIFWRYEPEQLNIVLGHGFRNPSGLCFTHTITKCTAKIVAVFFCFFVRQAVWVSDCGQAWQWVGPGALSDAKHQGPLTWYQPRP